MVFRLITESVARYSCHPIAYFSLLRASGRTPFPIVRLCSSGMTSIRFAFAIPTANIGKQRSVASKTLTQTVTQIGQKIDPEAEAPPLGLRFF